VTNSITFKPYLFTYYIIFIEALTSPDHAGSNGVRIIIEY